MLVELEQAHHHELYLLLGGETIADDGAFDGERSVLGDGTLAEGGGKEGDAADLAELEGALGVGGEEDFFNGDDVGLMQMDLGGELGEDVREALGGGLLFVEADGSGSNVEELGGTGLIVDDAVAGEFGTAVDAEDTHGGSLSYGGFWGGGYRFLPLRLRSFLSFGFGQNAE